MALFEQLPYTNFHNLNLGWILSKVKEMESLLTTFISLNEIKYANPIQWSITRQYEKNTVVVDIDGNGYLSVQAVPYGVSLDRTEYWTLIGNFSALWGSVKDAITTIDEGHSTTATSNRNTGTLVWLNNDLIEVTNNMIAGDAYVVGSNCRKYSVQTLLTELTAMINAEQTARENADITLQGNINAEQTARENADSTLQGNIDAEQTARENADSTLQGNIDDEQTARENADTVLHDYIDSEIEKNKIYFNILNYGAVGDGITDDSQSLINALADASIVGGIVYIPPTLNGYLISQSEIVIPQGVELRGNKGHFRGYWASKKQSSTLLITSNKGYENIGTTYKGSAFVMMDGSAISNINFYYPEQTLGAIPDKYPFLIYGGGYRDMHVNNVYCENAYQFADFSNTHERVIIENVYFDAFKTGILIDGSLDVDRLMNIHCWIFSLQGNDITQAQKDNIIGFRLNNLTGIDVLRADGIQMSNIFVWGALNPLRLGDTGKACYGMCTNISTDGCVKGIVTRCLGGQGFTIANFAWGTGQDFKTTYNTPDLEVLQLNHASGSLEINNCYSWGGANRFIGVGSLYGSDVSNSAAISRTIISSATIIQNMNDEYIYNNGVNGEIVIKDSYFQGDDKFITTTPLETNTKIVIENPKISKYLWQGYAPVIKTLDNNNIATINASYAINIGFNKTIKITGTGTIEQIDGNIINGDKIILVFTDSCIVSGSTTNNLRLKAQYNTVANDTLELICMNNLLYEVSRSNITQLLS